MPCHSKPAVAYGVDEALLFWGGLLTAGGFVLLLTDCWTPAILGFVLIGLGASNIVPVLLSLAGRQTVMPAGRQELRRPPKRLAEKKQAA